MVITPPINTLWEYKLMEHLGFEEIVLFSKLSMLIIYSARTYYCTKIWQYNKYFRYDYSWHWVTRKWASTIKTKVYFDIYKCMFLMCWVDVLFFTPYAWYGISDYFSRGTFKCKTCLCSQKSLLTSNKSQWMSNKKKTESKVTPKRLQHMS